MPKIMIVNDEKDLLTAIKEALERSDNKYEVMTADSGMECFELLSDEQVPDLILLDLIMPEMNGWEVHKKLKETPAWRNIPVIFISTSENRTSELVGNTNVKDFIEKPFGIEDLKMKIGKILKK